MVHAKYADRISKNVYLDQTAPWPRGYKTIFMLNSAEQISDARKYKNIKKTQLFSCSDKPKMLFFLTH